MRTTTRRTTRWFGGLAALALALTACGGGGDTGGDGGDGGDPGEGDSVTIGFANEVPYGFQDDEGNPSGEAPAVASAVLEEMGITEIEGEVVEFGALISGVNAGQFDMVAAGMFITEERASQALFTDPDYCATTAFAVPEGNPNNLSDFESVGGDVTLGVLSGAVEEGYASDLGVENVDTYENTPDMVDALTTGRIDAFALTAVTVREQVGDLDGFEATEGFIPVIDGEEQLGCGGFVFSFDNKDFRDEFNEILVDMRENDEILPLVEEFGFTEAETEAAKGVTVEDLIGQPYDFGMNGGES